MLQANSIFIMRYEIATLVLLMFYMYIYYSKRKTIYHEFSEKYLNFMECIFLLNLSSILYRDIFTRIFNISILMMMIFLLTYFEKVKTKNAKIIFIGVALFAIAFGSVNLNNIIANDYSGIFG